MQKVRISITSDGEVLIEGKAGSPSICERLGADLTEHLFPYEKKENQEKSLRTAQKELESHEIHHPDYA